MGKEKKPTQMEMNIKEIFLKVKDKVKGNIPGIMETFIMECGKMIKKTEGVYGLMHLKIKK